MITLTIATLLIVNLPRITDVTVPPETHPIIQPIAVEIPQPVAEVRPITVPKPSGAVIPNCGDNSYANYIYMHESGCNTGARNSLGCLGIGQACPGSKLLNVCPNLDYACENAFFTNYANIRYNGWYNAYLFWKQNHWW